MKALNPQIELLQKPGLMTPSTSYKPFRYPWAIEFLATPATNSLAAGRSASWRRLQRLGDDAQ